MMELVDYKNAVLREIENPEAKRRDVARAYAMALHSSERERVNWRTVNEAIIARWSHSALEWIKKEAWRLAT